MMKMNPRYRLISAAAVGLFAASSLFGFSPQTWQFGSGEGRDGDGGFALLTVPNEAGADTAQWSVTADALRLTSSAGAPYNDFSAILPMSGLGGTNLQNFTITLEGTLISIGTDSWSYRGGIVALGDGALGTDYGTTDHYVASLHRIQSSERRLRLAVGPGGSTLVQTTPDSLSSEDAFTVRLEGTYDSEGALTMVASTWYNNDMGTMWTVGPHTVASPRDGTYFGIGGRLRSETEVDFHNLSIVPEPATYAFVGGLLALGLVLIRRRVR